ncbi:MAG: large-conductance mechanosensitive channel protein MscL [Oscillospiraceae bacterium]|nr:large-conductance mechanosensitive channel protein MscL [Oscillospiraceae bacterium]
MKKFFGEFKDFAMRGNVLDMAIGVVIGGAFGKITASLVNDIIMPFISMITGGVDFSQWKWVLKAADEVNEVAEVAVNFGSLLSVILDFIIIAFVMFLVVKGMNKLKKKKEAAEEAAAEPAGPTTEELLGEIRDLLKDRQ